MTIYIVWNEARTEGYATTDAQVAYEARKGADSNCFTEDGEQMKLAQAFCDLTGEESCTVQMVEQMPAETPDWFEKAWAKIRLNAELPVAAATDFRFHDPAIAASITDAARLGLKINLSSAYGKLGEPFPGDPVEPEAKGVGDTDTIKSGDYVLAHYNSDGTVTVVKTDPPPPAPSSDRLSSDEYGFYWVRSYLGLHVAERCRNGWQVSGMNDVWSEADFDWIGQRIEAPQ